MSHPDESELRAFLDDEVPSEERARLVRHLAACADCRARREELGRAEETVREALQALTPSPPDLEGARRAVGRRLARAGAVPSESAAPGVRSRRRSGWGGRPAPARAAAVVLLLLGGVAAGLPGSPVRQWLGDLWESGSGPDATAPATAPAEVDDAGEDGDADAEIRVEPSAGAVDVVLSDAAPGTRVQVRLVGGESAGVAAGAGARFRSGPGRMEVTGAGGVVRVEIPRSAREASVTANGRLLFRKEGGTVTLPSADPDTAGAELLFQIPAEG